MINDRVCDLCGTEVPIRSGLLAHGLFIHHDGWCYEQMKATEKDFSKSARGRKRPDWQIRQILRRLSQQKGKQ
jgi:hypothetical protein